MLLYAGLRWLAMAEHLCLAPGRLTLTQSLWNNDSGIADSP